MKRKWTGKLSGILILAAVLLLGISAANIGKAYARYQDTTSAEVKFKVRTEGTLAIDYPTATADESVWSVNENGDHQMTFTVSSQKNTNAVWYLLSLAATPGFEDGNSITLLVDNVNGITRTYEGKAVAFTNDSLLYQQMGPGYEYRFYDSEGKELCWQLEGENTAQEFSVVISDGTKANMIEIIATQTQKP